jgi:putative Mg2+ transporter-C (MgtC) family protein
MPAVERLSALALDAAGPAWSSWDVVLRLAAATVVGGLVGLNRELRDKPAGLRTHALVSLGAALVTVSALEVATRAGDPRGEAFARVAQGVITGIGFLGGGVILRDAAQQRIRGLTTAATIWVVACLGIACGAGHWTAALTAIVLTFAVLLFGGPVEDRLHRAFGKKKEIREDRRGRDQPAG